MKKLLALALILGLILTGCTKKNPTPEPTPTPTPEATPEVNEPTPSDSELLNSVNGVIANYELPGFMEMTDAELETLYMIAPADVEDYAILKPMMNVQASEIIVVTAKDGKLDTVKENIDKYMKAQEENWSTYLPAQYELVKNRVVKEVGNTYIVVVAEEAEKIAADIEAAIK